MKVTDNVYALDSTKGAYAYLIAAPDGAIMIDTGLPGRAKAMLAEIEGLGLSPRGIRTIVLTHHDVDHIGNAKRLQEATGAELWAPDEDAPHILGARKRPGVKRLIAAVARPPLPSLTGLYGDGRRFGQLRAIHAPGHTPGHSMLAYGKIIFIGDLFHIRRGTPRPTASFMNASPEAARSSIGLLNGLAFEWLCPAHGEPTRDGPDIRAFISGYERASSS
jgi:glyoxylase-like metal-dependent hydrolase (beta-lactamase superfamily II)